jgi:ABC-2 type transport system permease protein
MTLVQRSVFSELRALLAVAKKEWVIFRRYPSWVMVYVVWPLLFPYAFVFTAKAMSGPDGSGAAAFSALTGTTDYTSYLVLGTAVWMWLNLTLWDVGFHLRAEQMRGTLESNWLCPVWRLGIVLGASLTKLGTSLFFLVSTVIQFRLIAGVNLLGGNVWLVLLFLLLTMPSIYGIGLTFASLVIRFKEANTMVFLVRGVFMIFCGMTFPIEALPRWMQQAGSFLPLTHAIRGIRRVALTHATLTDVLPEIASLVLFAVLMPVVGYVAFHFAERQSRRTGALGQY